MYRRYIKCSRYVVRTMSSESSVIFSAIDSRSTFIDYICMDMPYHWIWLPLYVQLKSRSRESESLRVESRRYGHPDG